MAKQLRVRAISGDNKSDSFTLLQRDNGPKLDRTVALLVTDRKELSKTGRAQKSTSNMELGLYKSHDAEWLENTLKGFRVKHPEGAQIIVEVLSQGFLSVDDFNKEEKF